jgi:hypothetical protein
LDDIGLLKEVKRRSLYQTGSGYDGILDEKESLNVEVKAGYKEFIENFKKMIVKRNSKIKLLVQEEQKELLFKELETNKKEGVNIFKEGQADNEEEEKEIPGHKEFLNKAENINLAITPHKNKKFYFYKRWLWLIFPWACLSPERGYKYSDVIKKCYTGENRSIRMRQEERLARKALDICIEAKMKRKMILKPIKKDYLINPSSLPINKDRMSRTTATSFYKTKKRLFESKSKHGKELLAHAKEQFRKTSKPLK